MEFINLIELIVRWTYAKYMKFPASASENNRSFNPFNSAITSNARENMGDVVIITKTLIFLKT